MVRNIGLNDSNIRSQVISVPEWTSSDDCCYVMRCRTWSEGASVYSQVISIAEWILVLGGPMRCILHYYYVVHHVTTKPSKKVNRTVVWGLCFSYDVWFRDILCFSVSSLEKHVLKLSYNDSSMMMPSVRSTS